MDFKKEIIKILTNELKLLEINLESPSNSKLGDYSFPCFFLSLRVINSAKNLMAKIN